MTTFLITGAAGFIGSHLCEALLESGANVRGLDSFSPHYPRQLKELNLAGVRGEPRFEFLEFDLVSDELEEAVAGVDVVFHLAARPGVRDSWADLADYAATNVLGTGRLLDACVGRDLRFVYASSSSVYGDAAHLPVTESTPLAPVSPYGATKVSSETLASAYARSRKVDVVGLRYFTVYGPRQRPDMALSRFIEAAAAGQALRVFGDGRQLRDMTYVGDVVTATVAAARHGRPSSFYNVASGNPLALNDILDELGTVMGRELELAREEAKTGDVRDTWADITRARDELGWKPATELRTGLERQVELAEERRAGGRGGVAAPA